MNKNIHRLMEIAEKEERIILGLMSGTSLDGLDIALCRIKGHGNASEVTLLHFTTIQYPDAVKNEIRKVFAKPTIDFQTLVLQNPWLANLHAEYVLKSLHDWNIKPNEIDLVASHGQTVFHSPKRLHKQEKFPNATLQIGDGDHLAVGSGIITISDFRQKHLASGGEGAPLALYGDYFLFSKEGETRIMLNIGGIANFTRLNGKDMAGTMVTDTGPGNTLMDLVAKTYFNLPFDRDGKIARNGTVNEAFLKVLKSHPFFAEGFPKTTGPELFNDDYLQAALQQIPAENLNPSDILATITLFTASTIADAVTGMIGLNKATVYVSGGGSENTLLMEHLTSLLPAIPFKRTDELGIPAAAKEAILFAILANETIAGNPSSFPGKESMPSVSMGKISFPL